MGLLSPGLRGRGGRQTGGRRAGTAPGARRRERGLLRRSTPLLLRSYSPDQFRVQSTCMSSSHELALKDREELSAG